MSYMKMKLWGKNRDPTVRSKHQNGLKACPVHSRASLRCKMKEFVCTNTKLAGTVSRLMQRILFSCKFPGFHGVSSKDVRL